MTPGSKRYHLPGVMRGRKEGVQSMPRFMDVHLMVDIGLTPEQCDELHQKDLAVQRKHDVRFVKYWYDPVTGRAFCLSEAPSAEAVRATHQEAHGLVYDEIFEVFEGE